MSNFASISRSVVGSLLMGVLGAGCVEGQITGTSALSSGACAATTVPTRVRRLTHAEYNRTVEALLKDASNPAQFFPVDDRYNGYGNNSDVLYVTPLMADQLRKTAEQLSQSAPSTVFPPCKSGANEETCAQDFISTFGKRAFRRAVSTEEKEGLLTVYRAGRSESTHLEGLKLVVEAMLQSPSFLYSTELGDGTTVRRGVTRLTRDELAASLSYMLTASPPDEALVAAAESGALATPAGLKTQLERLVQSDAARAQMASFVFQWLELETDDRLDKMEKDTSLHPSFSHEMRSSMRLGAEAFVESVIYDGGDRRLSTLLKAPYAFVDKQLAGIYGVEAPEGGALRRVDMDPQERAGILTQAGLLAAYAGQTDSAPVRRGKLVRTRLLCQTIPKPPETLKFNFPARDEANTTRERFSQHSDNPACVSCHRLMDPVGFGFENYDALGAYRTTENGHDVDASGEVLDTLDTRGPFVGAVELATRLSGSAEVEACFARQLYQFVQAQAVSSADECNVRPLAEDFAAGDPDILALFSRIILSDTFALRSIP